MQVKSFAKCPREHSAILLNYIKLPFVFKTFVLSIFKWPLKIGFTVFKTEEVIKMQTKVKKIAGKSRQLIILFR